MADLVTPRKYVSPPPVPTCSSGHHDPIAQPDGLEPETSWAGIRAETAAGDLEPRAHYDNLIADNYATAGYVKFAELLEAGHGCAACHLTHFINRVPTDGEIDLERYSTIATLARGARVSTEIAVTGFMSAVSAMEVRLGSTSFRITAANLADPLDEITLRQIGTEIASNPVASRAYRQMQDQGTEVIFEFGRPPANGLDGKALRPQNQVLVYVQRHSSAKDVVRTMVHESSHIHRMFRGNVGSRLDEVRAFSRELLYERGRRPTTAERAEIWRQVQQAYAHLEE